MKNIILISLLFFIYSCGYTSVYKNLQNQDFNLIITDLQGDRDMNNLIKNQINLYSNKDSINKFNIEIDTKYDKSVLTKDSAGLVTDYELSVNSTFTVYFDQKSKKLTFSETINIKNRTDTFEQDAYERNIKKNFASSFRDKLISEILTLK
jgi:hypothetical protein